LWHTIAGILLIILKNYLFVFAGNSSSKKLWDCLDWLALGFVYALYFGLWFKHALVFISLQCDKADIVRLDGVRCEFQWYLWLHLFQTHKLKICIAKAANLYAYKQFLLRCLIVINEKNIIVYACQIKEEYYELS
jgi:hypothetical protein